MREINLRVHRRSNLLLPKYYKFGFEIVLLHLPGWITFLSVNNLIFDFWIWTVIYISDIRCTIQATFITVLVLPLAVTIGLCYQRRR